MIADQTQKSRRIGEVLMTARVQQRISVSKCAALLGTTRRRYTAIEAGESPIWAVELEVLCDFLGLSLFAVFPQLNPCRVHRIGIPPGESVEFFIDVASGKT